METMFFIIWHITGALSSLAIAIILGKEVTIGEVIICLAILGAFGPLALIGLICAILHEKEITAPKWLNKVIYRRK